MLKEATPEIALLKIRNAKCGTEVWPNGRVVGEHVPRFTPGLFGLTAHLRSRAGGGTNGCSDLRRNRGNHAGWYLSGLGRGLILVARGSVSVGAGAEHGHRCFKDMHWNALRYCIGFPVEFWYDIADDEGLLLQDKFPIWLLNRRDACPEHPVAAKMIPEYTE